MSDMKRPPIKQIEERRKLVLKTSPHFSPSSFDEWFGLVRDDIPTLLAYIEQLEAVILEADAVLAEKDKTCDV